MVEGLYFEGFGIEPVMSTLILRNPTLTFFNCKNPTD